MKPLSIIVKASWDDEAKVWVASSTDIDGLAVEAETLESLQVKVTAALTDLIELSGDRFDLLGICMKCIRNGSRTFGLYADDARHIGDPAQRHEVFEALMDSGDDIAIA
ncbi:MAG: hypothetical protein RIR97_112, partial [Pseudomonadota bacterium]